MEKQILKAIAHIKNVSKKNPDPARIFSYCHKNSASNYDYTSVVKKIEELIVNGVIDQNYKINNPETESDKNQQQEDARESDQTSSNISILSIPIQHDTLPDITPTSPTLTSTDHQQNKSNDSENPDFSTTIMQPSQLLTPTAENETSQLHIHSMPNRFVARKN